MAFNAHNLESLQHQITFSAEVVLQNQSALDLLNAEQGGTWILL